MSEQQFLEDKSVLTKVILAFATFFDKALDRITRQYMRFLVVLAVVLLIAAFLILFFLRENFSPQLGLWLAIGVAVILVIFACLAFTLEYTNNRLRYSKRTEEELKSALREVVIELEEQKTGRATPNPVKLIEVLDTRFDSEELHSLCVILLITYPNRMTNPSLYYDSLEGQGKASKIRELVLYCQRRNMLDELTSAILDQRPDVEM